MNIHDYYITPQEYDIAAANGISAQTLEFRVRSLTWDKSRAINTPAQKKRKLPEEWRHIAALNGVCYRTFLHRVNVLGWEPERAATEQLQDKKAQAKRAHEASRKYPKEILELLKVNGINYDTFRGRVRSGWNMLYAATRPPMTRSEIGLMVKPEREKYFFPGTNKRKERSN